MQGDRGIATEGWRIGAHVSDQDGLARCMISTPTFTHKRTSTRKWLWAPASTRQIPWNGWRSNDAHLLAGVLRLDFHDDTITRPLCCTPIVSHTLCVDRPMQSHVTVTRATHSQTVRADAACRGQTDYLVALHLSPWMATQVEAPYRPVNLPNNQREGGGTRTTLLSPR